MIPFGLEVSDVDLILLSRLTCVTFRIILTWGGSVQVLPIRANLVLRRGGLGRIETNGGGEYG